MNETLYLARPTTAPAEPASSDVVRPLIWDFYGSPRVSFFTGDLLHDGKPRATSRKPRQANVAGRSVWCVSHDGRQVILTDPRPAPSGALIFNTTDGLQPCPRIVVEPFALPESGCVNGFEIRELPDGYVDCLSWSGTVMNTFSSLHDAVVWALEEDAPVLDDRASRELDALAAELGGP